MLSNKAYNVLKWIALIALPALEILWTSLGNVWGWNYVPEIATTIAAIDVFLGALIGVSTISYNKKEGE